MSDAIHVRAEYDADSGVLRLTEPLEGVANHETVSVIVAKLSDEAAEPPWMRLEGSLDEQAGREIAATIKEAFGRDQIDE